VTCPNDPDCSPDCGRPEREENDRAISHQEADRIRARVVAGRCTLRANECGWTNDCTKHHEGNVRTRRAS
jgi:hypothetical protein